VTDAAAALTYYALMSLFPAALLGISLLGLLGQYPATYNAVVSYLRDVVPQETLTALDHSLRTADALPAARPLLRLAGLLHDLGKATTLADGHFIGHEVEGATLAQAVLLRLRLSRAEIGWIVRLVRQHMFAYEPEWTDTAVRRFIAKVGVARLDDLFELRRADNVGSGRPPDAAGLEELRRRVAGQLEARVALDRSGLAIDGDDLIRELGLEEGPRIGAILDALLERVMNDPTLNERSRLLELARAEAAQ
jgi:putative nucleotidyltransferase with HDIG domain